VEAGTRVGSARHDRKKRGIFIPDASQGKADGGKSSPSVRAPGTKGAIVPLDVKPVDCILFGKWSGCEIKLDGEDLLIMRESDVMGVMKAQESPSPKRRRREAGRDRPGILNKE
jgi:chaperonin GroES